jgi:hypothetical protein
METLSNNRKSPIVRVAPYQLERTVRRLAWRAFRAQVEAFVRAFAAERRSRRALQGA